MGLNNLQTAVAENRQCLVSHAALTDLPDNRAGLAPTGAFRPFLQQRKAAKLLSPAARLALSAAGSALDGVEGDRTEMGLFVGVGREPPDDGEAEAALAAACVDGKLHVDQLLGVGRDLYTPLLPLRTLPNMVLAHCAIHLGIEGENGCWAGGSSAGWMAFSSAFWSVVEGRSPWVLAGAADSLIQLGLARDRLRQGARGCPGEAAVFFLLEAPAHAQDAGRVPLLKVRWVGDRPDAFHSLRTLFGDCGAAEALLHLAGMMSKPLNWGGFHLTMETDL